MKIIDTEIPEVKIIEPELFGDDRGYFFESFSQKEFGEKIYVVNFVQDNESKSDFGVLRGLHYQIGEHAQAKLVRVVKGAVLDVAVDIRKGSPTFGKHVSVLLTETNHRQLFIPRGFAHGFISLKKDTIFQYKCDNFYNKDSERGIIWNDEDLNIDWMTHPSGIILSEKDKLHPTLKNSQDLFDYEYINNRKRWTTW